MPPGQARILKEVAIWAKEWLWLPWGTKEDGRAGSLFILQDLGKRREEMRQLRSGGELA
jgi:hypothetical protein